GGEAGFEGPLELAGLGDLYLQALPSPLLGRGLGDLPVADALRSPVVPEHPYRPRRGHKLLEELESLPHRVELLEAQPRDVAAGPTEAAHIAITNWIGCASHHDRDRGRGLLDRGD